MIIQVITVAINCNITFNRQRGSLGDRQGAFYNQIPLDVNITANRNGQITVYNYLANKE